MTLPLDAPSGPDPLGDALSARERDVLRLVVAGERNRAIAAELGIGETTVTFHVSNLLRKTGTTTRAQLAVLGHG